jgi:hypothetical protein
VVDSPLLSTRDDASVLDVVRVSNTHALSLYDKRRLRLGALRFEYFALGTRRALKKIRLSPVRRDVATWGFPAPIFPLPFTSHCENMGKHSRRSGLAFLNTEWVFAM